MDAEPLPGKNVNKRRGRRSVRARLALLLVTLLVTAGAVLLAVNYALVRSRLEPQVDRASTSSLDLGGTAGAEPGSSSNAAEPAPDPSPAELGAAEVRAAEERLIDEALRQLVIQSALALSALSLVSIAIGWIVSGRILRPVQIITDTARRLSDRDLSQRIDLSGPDDELKELADTFDDMLARLDRAFAGERLFIANASHELRTPLAVARAAVDVFDAKPSPTVEHARAMAGTVRSSVDRSDRLIQGLLALAVTEQRGFEAQTIDLAGLVAGELSVAGDLPEVRRSLSPTLVVGDATLLAHLVRNLIENAARYNVPDGWIEIATDENDRGPVLRVSNPGPDVAPERVASLFEPFRRGDHDRVDGPGGAGIGLSVVAAVARKHDAEAVAVARAGGGLDLTVQFPRSVDTADVSRRPQAAGAVGAGRPDSRHD